MSGERFRGRKVLVTGGAGFIGSSLVKTLLARGAEVAVFDDFRLGRRSFLPADGRIRTIEGDVRDAGLLRKVLLEVRPAAAIHLAAVHYIPWCEAHPEEAWAINVEGTRNLLDACEASAPEVVFVASSAAIYPVSDRPHREEDPTGPVEPYGRTKVEAERLLAAFHARTGIRSRAGRFFNGYGPRETNPHLIPEIQRQLRGGARRLRLGSLSPVRDYIYVEDLAEGILAATEDGVDEPFGVFNVGTGRGTSVEEVVAAFGEALGEPIEVEHDPARLRKVERPRLVADARRLEGRTGWRARVSFSEGVRRLLRAEPVDPAAAT